MKYLQAFVTAFGLLLIRGFGPPFLGAVALGRHFIVITGFVFFIQLVSDFDSPVTSHLFWAQLMTLPMTYVATRPTTQNGPLALVRTTILLIMSLAFLYNLTLAAFHFLRWGGFIAAAILLCVIAGCWCLGDYLLAEDNRQTTQDKVTANNGQRPVSVGLPIRTLMRRPWWLRWM